MRHTHVHTYIEHTNTQTYLLFLCFISAHPDLVCDAIASVFGSIIARVFPTPYPIHPLAPFECLSFCMHLNHYPPCTGTWRCRPTSSCLWPKTMPSQASCPTSRSTRFFARTKTLPAMPASHTASHTALCLHSLPSSCVLRPNLTIAAAYSCLHDPLSSALSLMQRVAPPLVA